MSILHYFSKDPNKRAKFIFNFIAPIYNKVDKILDSSFQKSIDLLKEELPINNLNVVDVGTGTGAWGAMFLKNGAKSVTGIDFAEKMLAKAKIKHPKMNFEVGDAENLEKIKNDSFDLVTASYVLHGVKKKHREKILSEMKRISRKYIVIHDFVGKTPAFIRFLEFMEKSDYKFFKKNFCNELKLKFLSTKRIKSRDGSGLYIAQV